MVGLILFSRSLRLGQHLLEVAKRLGKKLKLTPIGKEAFVFFVNEKNPVKSLAADEIKGIYAGDITNWRAVGGRRRTFVHSNVLRIAAPLSPSLFFLRRRRLKSEEFCT